MFGVNHCSYVFIVYFLWLHFSHLNQVILIRWLHKQPFIEKLDMPCVSVQIHH